MTRINVVDPEMLTDQHALAEYRELPMVMGSLRRSLNSKNGLPPIPKSYTLNKWHVSFFYNEGKFLEDRYRALCVELKRRGYEIDPNRAADFNVFKENMLDKDWQPDATALSVSVQRIIERINQKWHWYRYNGVKLTELEPKVQLQLLAPMALWKR